MVKFLVVTHSFKRDINGNRTARWSIHDYVTGAQVAGGSTRRTLCGCGQTHDYAILWLEKNHPGAKPVPDFNASMPISGPMLTMWQA